MSSEIRVGVAVEDISPYDNYELLTPTGMGRNCDTLGVLDELRVEAMALEAAGELVFIFTSDLRIVPTDWADEIRQSLSEQTPCDARHIFFSAVHNHCSSPAPRRDDEQCKEACKAADRKMIDGFISAAKRALKDLAPSELAATTAECVKTIGQCRRIKMDNGTCINGWGSGPMIAPGRKMLGPVTADSTRIDILSIRRSGQANPHAVLSAYGTHPHLYQLPYFSGEFPGAAKREIESRLNGTVAMHANTIGGDIDIHCIHPMPDGEENKVKWFRDSADELGRRFADSVIPALPASGFVSEGEFKFAEQQVDCALVAVMTLGDIAFISIPGELFSNFGRRLHAQSPFKHNFVLAYNGTTTGYVGEGINYEQGSYEVMRGPRSDPKGKSKTPRATETLGNEIIDAVLEMLDQLK